MPKVLHLKDFYIRDCQLTLKKFLEILLEMEYDGANLVESTSKTGQGLQSVSLGKEDVWIKKNPILFSHE